MPAGKDKITLLSRIIFILSLQGSVQAADIKQTTNPDTGLISWTLTEDNFHIELIQRLPDQTRAFFQARDFSVAIANDIATHCMFQTIVKNTAKTLNLESIKISLSDWQIKVNEKTSPIILKESWDKKWQTKAISNTARIAFLWATFPNQQTLDATGDTNWGMISLGPPPGTNLDIHIHWMHGNQSKDAWIRNIKCPIDRHL